MIIIITGRICAGKSTAVAQLKTDYETQGIPVLVLELDKIGHEVLGFQVDRAQLADRVFAKPTELARLEARLHPQIMAQARQRAEAFLATNADGVVLIEAPLPLKVKEYPWLSKAEVRVLDVCYGQRLQRALGRGMTAEQFELRDKAQQNYVYGQES